MADASRVVLGLGGCVDYELKLTAGVLRELVARFGIRAAELTSPGTVTTERDLVVSILSYVARGRGGEHFVASAAALESFAGRPSFQRKPWSEAIISTAPDSWASLR